MPWLVWGGVAWLGSKVLLNVSETAENVADAGTKTAGAALLGLGAFMLYKKVVK